MSPPHVFSGSPEELKSERRGRILPVDVFERRILEGLRRKTLAVDYGAGAGHFTLPLARHFRRVVAVDMNVRMVEELRRELESLGLANVEVILSSSPPELEERADFVLLSSVLHEVDDPAALISWASGARSLCVIEWNSVRGDIGPPPEERLEKTRVMEQLKGRFRYIREPDIYPYHYTLVAYHEEGFWTDEGGGC